MIDLLRNKRIAEVIISFSIPARPQRRQPVPNLRNLHQSGFLPDLFSMGTTTSADRFSGLINKENKCKSYHQEKVLAWKWILQGQQRSGKDLQALLALPNVMSLLVVSKADLSVPKECERQFSGVQEEYIFLPLTNKIKI